jgi:hypothetical protein
VISASRLSTRAEGALHTASTEHERPAGIHLRTHTVELKHGSLLDSSTLNANPGGQVTLQAQTSIHLQQHSRIASTVGDGVQSASGDGGNILLETPYLTLTEGSVIQTGAGAFLQPNSGNAGSIFMQVGAMFLKDRSSFITSTLSDGQGGDIVLTADRMVLDNAAITASSLGQGNAGQVRLNAGALEMRNISVISTRALAAGGGDITLHLQQHLFLWNSAMSAIALGNRSQDNGGNIAVYTPTFIVLDQSEIFASALAGNGGNISLTADYLLTHFSQIDASSVLGIDGEIRLDSPIIDLDRRLFVLPTHYADASEWINQPCVERLADDISSLIWLEQEVLPISPYGLRSHDPLINTALNFHPASTCLAGHDD